MQRPVTLSLPVAVRLALAAAVALAALLATNTMAEAAPRVVASTGDLAALAAAVGGPDVRVDSLAASTEDPHYVDPRPAFVVTLSRADLLIVNGSDLEIGWIPPLVQQSRNPHVQPGRPGYLDASAAVELVGATDAVDRAQGDVHPGGNPHFTIDPRRALAVVEAIRGRLSELDPTRAPAYAANAATAAAAIQTVVDAQRARFAALPGSSRQVVVYHDSLVYLVDWLGLRQVATIEPRPGVPPDPRHVAGVLGSIRDSGVRLILQEGYYPRNTSQTLAETSGARLVVIDGQTRHEAGQSYVEHVVGVCDALWSALQGG